MDRRHLLSALAGAAVGIALFWLMPRLISPPEPPGDYRTPIIEMDTPRPPAEPPPVTPRPTPPPKPNVTDGARRPVTPLPTEPVAVPTTPTAVIPVPQRPTDPPGIDLNPPQVTEEGEPGLEDYGLEVRRSFAPQYPPGPQREGIEGWVEVEFTVTVTGGVRDARVVAAEPRQAELERAALRAMARWTFRPPTRDGVATEVVARQRFTFRLVDD